MRTAEFIGLEGLPLIETGDDLARIILDAVAARQLSLVDGDVLAVTSKVVSKSEGRWVDLNTIIPDDNARRVAEQCGKDPREVAVILSEASEVSRVRQGVLIVRHRLGFVCANAGMDHSNTRPGAYWRLLLPQNPDLSAATLRDAIKKLRGVTVGIVITDSHGRPFRVGTVGVAIGSAGIPALWDLRGKPDLLGSPLQVTEVAFADEIAAAAGLIMGQADEKTPVVLVRGLNYPVDDKSHTRDLIRPLETDLYR